MRDTLLTLSLFGLTLVVTGWKLIGWSGSLCFTARWLVQAIHRHRTNSNGIPGVFWWISLGGSSATLVYFIFGKNDSVGIISNLFPMLVAAYNLWLNAKPKPPPAQA